MTARPLSRGEKEVWDNARAFGWSNGFVLPIHGPGGYFAILSMASPERDLDLHPERLLYLQMIALLAHERCCALANITPFRQPDRRIDRSRTRMHAMGRCWQDGRGDREYPVGFGGND